MPNTKVAPSKSNTAPTQCTAVNVENQHADNTAAKQADVAEARKDAAAEKNEANYKAAKERCDALSGDVKSKCVDDAKRVHGQN